MKHVVLSIRDMVADLFQPPFYQPNKGAGLRAFADAVNHAGDNMLYKHPDDYALYYLGTYDDNDATFELIARPEQLVLGRDLVEHKQHYVQPPNMDIFNNQQN